MDDQCDTKRDEMSSSDITSIKTEPISDTSHQYVDPTDEEPPDETQPQTLMPVKEEFIDIKYSDSVSMIEMEIKQEQEYTTQDDPSHSDNCHFTGLTSYIKPDNVYHTGNHQTPTRNCGETLYSCFQCDKSFNQAEHLEAHMKIHTDRQKPYSGSHCDERFAAAFILKNDNITDSVEKTHSCSQCDKRFTHKKNLKTHMRIHTGEKPYSCSQCDKSFTQNSILKTHMRTHTGEKPYSCSQCDKSFTHNISLKTHMITHSRKQNSCSQCDKWFAQAGSLKSHMRIHTDREKTYSCSQCD